MLGKITIGNAQGFWGDSPNAAYQLVSQYPELDFLTMDYLSEVSMSIMAIQREKNIEEGYAKDFLEVVKSLIPLWKEGARVRLITNAGGLNPLNCAEKIAHILKNETFRSWKIGVVYGDDVLDFLKSEKKTNFSNLETNEPLSSVQDRLITANAYLGSQGIVKALEEGADIIVTGRIADPCLTVAPCVASFEWSWQDYDKIASATVAGHLIECGTQVTGGVSTNWLGIPSPEMIGFPIIEMSQDGSFVVTKPDHTGGVVSEQTVKEQLLYEISDPDNYLSPDVTVSFTSLQLKTVGPNHVFVEGAKGRAPTDFYKVSATYTDGYKLEAFLTFFGLDVVLKAKKSGQVIFDKVKRLGYELARTSIECLGSLDVVHGVFTEKQDLQECVLRIAAADPRKEALDCLAKEIAPMITSGPQGVTGYTSGRPSVRQVFGYWPCLIEKKLVNPEVKTIEVNHVDIQTSA